MTRVANTNLVVCDGCGVEITWAPVVVEGQTYCCRDCAEGRVCQCDYPPEERSKTEPEASHAPQ
ncbi:MAG: hypothetical protein U9R25_00765 [Chloroflexota bacterium]|nr:hypothetical protein [Chloroflexota bacterium]